MSNLQVLSAYALNWYLACSILMAMYVTFKIVGLKFSKAQYSKLDPPPLWSILIFFILCAFEAVYLCYLQGNDG